MEDAPGIEVASDAAAAVAAVQRATGR
jgi:hypothetical protein